MITTAIPQMAAVRETGPRGRNAGRRGSRSPLQGLLGAPLVLAVICFLAAGGDPARADDRAAAVAKANELIEMTGVTAIASQMLQSSMQQLFALLVRLNPNQGPVIESLLEEVLVPEFQRRMPEFMALSAELYARHFTAAELGEIIAFYRTPVGQKAIKQLPLIAQEAVRLGESWGGQVALEAIEKLLPKLEEKGLKAPQI